MALISGVLVLIFGGLTLLVHDKAFIQWKVTVVNWLFAGAFLASHYFGDKPLIERMMGENCQLERALWRRLNWAWIGFFTAARRHQPVRRLQLSGSSLGQLQAVRHARPDRRFRAGTRLSGSRRRCRADQARRNSRMSRGQRTSARAERIVAELQLNLHTDQVELDRRQPPARRPCRGARRQGPFPRARRVGRFRRPAHVATPSAGLSLAGRAHADRHPRAEHHRADAGRSALTNTVNRLDRPLTSRGIS